MPQLKRQVPDGGIRAVLNDEASDTIEAKRLVAIGTTAEIGGIIAATATAKLIGVSMEAIAAGRLGDVQKSGVAIVTAGTGGVAIGDRITAEAGGKGIATTTEDNTVAGEALTAADADDDFMIELRIGSHVP